MKNIVLESGALWLMQMSGVVWVMSVEKNSWRLALATAAAAPIACLLLAMSH